MRIGLIAGNGKFPFLALDAAKSLGHDVTVVAIQEEASPEMSQVTLYQLKWQSAALSNYQYEFSWQCFCLPDYVAPVLVTVREEVIEVWCILTLTCRWTQISSIAI